MLLTKTAQLIYNKTDKWEKLVTVPGILCSFRSGGSMEYDKTELHFLQRDCELQFGEEHGGEIFRRAAKLYAELVVTTDYRNDEALKRQLKGIVYPVIAYYKTLLAEGYREPAALGLVRTEVEKAAKNCAEILRAQTRKVMPFAAFRRNIKKFMGSKFPASVWKYSEPKVKRARISFDVTQCLYYTVTKKFGCVELCSVFCEYEIQSFYGLKPKIVCERNGELATGHSVCGYVFHKG